MSVDRTLSDRMKLGREAAPWVIEKVEALEHAFAELVDENMTKDERITKLELEQRPVWIPVEEQRPELGRLVVCKCLEDYPQVGYFVEEEYWEDEGMSYIFKNVWENFIVVEAWCELPE